MLLFKTRYLDDMIKTACYEDTLFEIEHFVTSAWLVSGFPWFSLSSVEDRKQLHFYIASPVIFDIASHKSIFC